MRSSFPLGASGKAAAMPPPERIVDRRSLRMAERGPVAWALGLSLVLHGSAFAGLALLSETAPPEPYRVIAVTLVQNTGPSASPHKSTSGESSLSEAPATRQENGDAAATKDDEPVVALTETLRSAPLASRPHRPTQMPTAATRSSATLIPEHTAMVPVPPPPLPPPRKPPTLLAFEPQTVATPAPAPLPAPPRQTAPASEQHGADQPSAPKRQKSDAAGPVDDASSTSPESTYQESASLQPAARGTHGTGGFGEASTTLPVYAGAGLANPAPHYPFVARRNGQEGRVVLRVQVSAAGNAKAIAVRQSSGYRLLDQAALAAVESWRFVPAKQGNVSVAGWVDVPISFQLKDR